MTLCLLFGQSYPKKLAYEYLDELQNEFGRLYGGQVDAAARPYAFIKFGMDLPFRCPRFLWAFLSFPGRWTRPRGRTTSSW